MQQRIIHLTLIAALSMVSYGSPVAGDELFNTFSTPPAEAKPFVRWWWGENSVVAKEILREIEVMHQAGIGGYEINPISLPVPMEFSSPSLQWLSPEFNRLVKVAVDATKERGMIADLIVGSGWPFGAEFLKPGDMTKRLYLNSIAVEGPASFSTTAFSPHHQRTKGFASAGGVENVLKSSSPAAMLQHETMKKAVFKTIFITRRCILRSL
jgi:hypothetical protein